MLNTFVNLCTYSVTWHNPNLDLSSAFVASLTKKMESCFKVSWWMVSPEQTTHIAMQKMQETRSEDENSFKCAICKKEFKLEQCMKVHENSVHSEIRPFSCATCKKTFKFNGALKKHMISHNAQPENCPICYKTVKNVNRHNESVHTKTKLFHCDICEKKFSQNRNLEVHTDMHTNKRYNCTECKKEYAHNSNLKAHMEIHRLIPPEIDTCKVCNKKFPTSRFLHCHETNVHSKQLSTCNYCQKAFTSQASMNYHVKNSHETSTNKEGQKKVACSYTGCVALFQSPSFLKVHMVKHSTIRLFSCELCEKKFKRQHGLKHHQFVHSGKRPHKCSLCPFDTHDSQILRRHLLGHNGKATHKCDQCDKTFLSLSRRNSHYKIVHLKIKPFKCDICDNFAFTEKKDLSRHKTKVHEDEVSEKPSSCERCGKCFAKATYMKRHMITHTGNKSHTCKVCHKLFSFPAKLEVHMRTHTGEKPFECKFCSKKFTQTSARSGHVRRNHTGETPFPCNLCGKAFTMKVYQERHTAKNHALA